MIIEFWGGPHDGEQMVVTDGTRYLDLPVAPSLRLTQQMATGDVVAVDIVRCYFGRRADGSVIARWPWGCA